MIKWFNVKERVGAMSLYQNYLTLNTTAMYPFEDAYRVQVGVDENRQIIIKPVTKEVVESGVLDEYSLIKIDMRKSFARISSVALLKSIGEELRLVLSKTPIHFQTIWDDKKNILIATTKKGNE
ncbi:MAG: hypothetical protein GX813_04685 [Erysipelotrichia bacterium]|nr:hypothetical protein [Erysipelotrichia bacterium]